MATNQTITITNWLANFNETTFFGVQWNNVVGGDQPLAGLFPSTFPNTFSDATAAAEEFESTTNAATDAAAPIYTPPITGSDYHISVTGAMDGSSLVLTVEFSGPAFTGEVDLGVVSDWGDCDMPVVAYAGPAATAPDPIDDLAATPGPKSLEFTWTAPDDGGAAITKYTLYLNGVEHTDDVESPHEVTGLVGGSSSGPWTVTATNSEGESDPSNSVTENVGTDVPDAIDDLAAEPGDESLTLTWTEPEDNGENITSYALFLNGVEVDANVTSPHEITGLTNGTPSGPWTVKSTNMVGQSDASNAVTETPVGPPEAIDDLAATPGVGTLTFTWSAPANGGSAITKYTIYLNGVVSQDFITSPFEKTGLDPGVEIGAWTVTATNDEGESEASNGVTATPLSNTVPGRARLLLGVG